MWVVMVVDYGRGKRGCGGARCSCNHDSSQKFGSIDMPHVVQTLNGAVSFQVDLDRDEGCLGVETKSATWVSWVRLFDMEAENEHVMCVSTNTFFAAVRVSNPGS